MNQELLILLALENANIIHLLEKIKNKRGRKVWVHEYFNRKNAVIAFKKNVSTMKMAGKILNSCCYYIFLAFIIRLYFIEGKEFYRQFSRISEEGFLFILENHMNNADCLMTVILAVVTLLLPLSQ